MSNNLMATKKTISNSGIFGAASSFDERFVPNYKRLKELSQHLKGIGLRIVLTQGTYDMVHIGHARYFEEAKKHGDILIVGVDSDKKVRARKGPDRPLVPQAERLEMVTHLRPVDMVTVKELDMPKWHLLKTVEPDVLIITHETMEKYGKEKMKQMGQYCGKIVILEPMATTSTSAKLRRLQLQIAKRFEKVIMPKMADMVNDLFLSNKPKEKFK